MCTAISYHTGSHYFGRNLDLEYSYGEQVIITPRNYLFHLRNGKQLKTKQAMIGIGIIEDGYPLYYDAVNESGLCIAGLNFPGNAFYQSFHKSSTNLTPYELIPFVLSHYSSISSAKAFLSGVNIWALPFNDRYGLTPLHWMVSDSQQSLTVEPGKSGICLHHNPVGVLTNNPPFDYHMYNLSNYMGLSATEPQNTFAQKVEIKPYSRGMGAIGLPGDCSSASRFIRATFTLQNSLPYTDEDQAVCQFFHILSSVAQTEGCVKVDDRFEKTIYSSCCNTKSGVYYYTTYTNRQITVIDMHKEDLNGSKLIAYPLITKQQYHIPISTSNANKTQEKAAE